MKIIDVVISEVKSDENEKRNYVDIVFYLDEGEQWIFGGFSFEGNTLYTDENFSTVLPQIQVKALTNPDLNPILLLSAMYIITTVISTTILLRRKSETTKQMKSRLTL